MSCLRLVICTTVAVLSCLVPSAAWAVEVRTAAPATVTLISLGDVLTDGRAVATRVLSPSSAEVRLDGRPTRVVDGCTIGQPYQSRALARCNSLLPWANRVLNLLRGTSAALPPPQPADQLGRLGRMWAEGTASDPEGRNLRALFVNWRTGERRELPYDQLGKRDLDDPGLGRREEFRTVGSMVLDGDDPESVFPGGVPRLSVRIDGRRVVLRKRCQPRCAEVQAVSGIVTWREGATGWVYQHERRALTRLVISEALRVGQGLTEPRVTHTRRWVYLTYPRISSSAEERGPAVFRWRLPGG